MQEERGRNILTRDTERLDSRIKESSLKEAAVIIAAVVGVAVAKNDNKRLKNSCLSFLSFFFFVT